MHSTNSVSQWALRKVSLGDLSSQWEGSKWKQLKVHWDEQMNFERPDRVSPWEIEPCSSLTPTVAMNKRPMFLMDQSDSLALGSD
ncbi:hypothetical protein IEQ34_010656 [Dendrobium chrysotoxum]|uniref:Auxin response factor domain-containing protein n=1 Tax=Dendrobium chrysotoxum TaxID=161865 RepID=A0AAV7GWE8_DENCH|nr:hypothetical protein IEQ34_010656 [Dendrobium chrysotoxum]